MNSNFLNSNIRNLLVAASVSMAIVSSPAVLAAGSALPAKPEAQSKATESQKPEVDAQMAKQAEEKRKALLADAEAALKEVESALSLLNKSKPKEALAALERATGKLTLLVARDPKLALAPISTEVITHDLIASLDTVKAVVKEARGYMDDGEIQKARPLVAALASEMVFRTKSIPLATFPNAIKAVSPLIDSGKLDEAKTALQVALNSLVVTDEVIPLPFLRAQLLLTQAEKLAEQKNRAEKDNEILAQLLASAREQLELAEALGYGKKSSFKQMYEQIEQIEKKSAGGKSGTGWFDSIKKQISNLF